MQIFFKRHEGKRGSPAKEDARGNAVSVGSLLQYLYSQSTPTLQISTGLPDSIRAGVLEQTWTRAVCWGSALPPRLIREVVVGSVPRPCKGKGDTLINFELNTASATVDRRCWLALPNSIGNLFFPNSCVGKLMQWDGKIIRDITFLKSCHEPCLRLEYPWMHVTYLPEFHRLQRDPARLVQHIR